METITTDLHAMDMLTILLLLFAIFSFAHLLNILFKRWEDMHHARRMREIRRNFYRTDREWWEPMDRDNRYIQEQTEEKDNDR